MASWLRPRHFLRRLRLLGKDRETIFTDIYERQLWDASESVSGGGSTLAATTDLREQLPRELDRLGIRSLLDAPCGDFHWMGELDLDLELYVGGDIVRQLVEGLKSNYGTPERQFLHLDITEGELPEVDAWLCRDCLLHLSNPEIHSVLDNALRSSCAYFLVSNYPECGFNSNIKTGFSRPVNLCRPPFDWPSPDARLGDSGSKTRKKELAIWDLRHLRARVGS